MQKREQISSAQLGLLFFAGMTGSSIALIPGSLAGAAGNGAWISLLIAFLFGLLFLAAIVYLHQRYEGKGFVEYGRTALGTGLMAVLCISYIGAMFWQVAIIVVEVSGFFKSTMLLDTPSYAINGLFFLVIALTARAGIEVMARMFVILVVVMIGFIVLVWLLVSPNYHFDYLLPVMPDGIRPILHGAYIAYGFPYVEVVLYATLFPFVREQSRKKIGKTLFLALLFNGVALLASIVLTLSVLGPLAGEMKYSLYVLARLIFVQEIIERIESVVGFSLIVGSYMKTSLLLFVLTNVLSQLFKLKDDRLLTFPIAFICLLLSVTMYRNEMSFMEDGYKVWLVFINVAYVLPVLIIVAATLFRGIGKRLKSANH